MSVGLKSDVIVDVSGETCPIPLVEMRKSVMKAEDGDVIEIIGTHAPSKEEIPMAVNSLGLQILRIDDDDDGSWHIYIKK